MGCVRDIRPDSSTHLSEATTGPSLALIRYTIKRNSGSSHRASHRRNRCFMFAAPTAADVPASAALPRTFLLLTRASLLPPAKRDPAQPNYGIRHTLPCRVARTSEKRDRRARPTRTIPAGDTQSVNARSGATSSAGRSAFQRRPIYGCNSRPQPRRSGSAARLLAAVGRLRPAPKAVLLRVRCRFFADAHRWGIARNADVPPRTDRRFRRCRLCAATAFADLRPAPDR